MVVIAVAVVIQVVIAAAQVAVDIGRLHLADLQVVKRAEIIFAGLVNQHHPARQIAKRVMKVQYHPQDVYAAAQHNIQEIVALVSGIQQEEAVEAHHHALRHKYIIATHKAHVLAPVVIGVELLADQDIVRLDRVQRALRHKQVIVIHKVHAQELEPSGAEHIAVHLVQLVHRHKCIIAILKVPVQALVVNGV